jgi:hypothetical protein
MGLTLGQAAKAGGLSKPTLAKHIKNGKLSASKDENGVYDIDESELGRFMASRKSTPADPAPAAPAKATTGDALALGIAEERARQLSERLEETAARLAAAEARADAAQARADEAWNRVAGLLEAPKGQDSWWKRFAGKR